MRRERKRLASLVRMMLLSLLFATLVTGCAREFTKALKSSDYAYKYELAKSCYYNGKYNQAIQLLQELVTIQKGNKNGQECLFLLAMAEYDNQDYETASEYFKKYYSSYPRGNYSEQAKFFIAQSLYMSTPEPRLDQSSTLAAIAYFQEFLDTYPSSDKREFAQQRMIELQNKLVRKELYSARLYYNLGTYFGNCGSGGNNYEACIVTSQNALKEYPYSDLREDFALLIMKSKFELAQQSIDSKKLERFQDAEDECYGFINEYPDSRNRQLAEKYISQCKRFTQNSN